MKKKQVEKLDEEAAEDEEEGAALQEDLELPLRLLSGWGGSKDGKHDPTAPKGLGTASDGDGGDGSEALATIDATFIVSLRGVSFGYPNGPILFSDAEFSIDGRSRIVLLGENGNGKTTLVKVILGELAATAGEVKINPKCRIAMVNQHHADQLDLSLSPLAFMRRKFPGDGSYDHDQVCSIPSSVHPHIFLCDPTAV